MYVLYIKNSMSQLSVGVNLIGDFASSDEIKNNKSIIENIINLITSTICDAEKKDDIIPLISTIKNTIQSKFPDYNKLCVETPDPDPTKGCPANKILFTDKRILDIIEKIRNNTEYRRICKFKYSALNGYIEKEILRKVLYSLNRYPIQYYNFPYAYMAMPFSGGRQIENGNYGLGTLNIDGKSNSIGFVDFDSFVDQYEKYHTPQNNKLHIKSCESINGKIKCTAKTYKLNNEKLDSKLELDSESESEDYNVITNGKNKKLDKAYKALFNFLITDVNGLLDKIDELLDHIKYYVLPLKTLEKAEKVNAKISQK